jgi:hypothetical protein
MKCHSLEMTKTTLVSSVAYILFIVVSHDKQQGSGEPSRGVAMKYPSQNHVAGLCFPSITVNIFTSQTILATL